jgi:hypothetical protein
MATKKITVTPSNGNVTAEAYTNGKGQERFKLMLDVQDALAYLAGDAETVERINTAMTTKIGEFRAAAKAAA